MTNDTSIEPDDELDPDEAAEDYEDLADEPTPGWQKALAIGGAVVLTGAIMFGIGRFTAFDTSPAASTPSSSSADAGFARDMQTHHEQAVYMAMIMYQKTDDPDVRALTYDMATSQSVQLGQMQQWLIDWNLPAYSSQPDMQWMSQADGHEGHGSATQTPEEIRKQMGMASDAELNTFANAPVDEATCQFFTLMIRHHKGAIDMTDAIEQLGSNANVLTLAGKMSTAQAGEIRAMESMQERFGCSG